MTRLFRALLFLLALWMIGAFAVCFVGMRKARAEDMDMSVVQNLYDLDNLMFYSKKTIAAYYYKKGWNEGIDKVYGYERTHQREQSERVRRGDITVPVGGFVNTSWGETQRSVSHGEWDFKKMRYK